MTELKILHIVILGLLMFGGLCVLVFGYFQNKDGCQIKLSFQEFHFYYRLNPDHWTLYNGYVRYEYDVQYHNCSGKEHLWICFPFGDYLIYGLWYWTHGRMKQKEEKDGYRKRFDELMKKELENYNKNLSI